MQDVKGTLTCVAGKMPLAKIVQDYLVQHFPLQTPRPADVPLGVELTRWFCPGCGVHLQELICPRCGGSIRSMHHSLVERHYHEGEAEAYQRWKAQQDAAPNSRPAGQSPTPPDIQTSDSPRTPHSGGCG